jgi:hypothetical protein
MTKKNNPAKCTSRTTPPKPRSRNDLFAALVSLVECEGRTDKVEPGFMTVSQFSEVFMLGPKQTYVWLERMCKAEVAEKKSYRVQVGMYVRQVPHYKLGKKAKAIIDQIKSGR